MIHTTLGCPPSLGISHEVGEYRMLLAVCQLLDAGAPQACRLMGVRSGSGLKYELTRHGLCRLPGSARAGAGDVAAVHVHQRNHVKRAAAGATAIKALVNIGSKPSPVAHRCLQ